MTGALDVEPRAGIMEVTPEMAGAWLSKRNRHNRDLVWARVEQYERDIRRGAWDLNGESIKFAKSGLLLDGQHRLFAITEARKSMRTVVVTGLEESSQETMDQGLPRSFGDALKLRGESDYFVLAAATVVVCLFERDGVPFRSAGKSQPTIPELSRCLARNGELRESVKVVQAWRRGWLPVSQCVGLHYLFGLVDGEASTRFFERLAKGVGLSDVEPVYVLRERLIAEHDRQDGARLAAKMKIAFIVRAWNAERRGETIKRLMWDPKSERFPGIEGVVDRRGPEAETVPGVFA